MDAVVKGETNEDTLRETAVKAMPKKPSDDPIPPAEGGDETPPSDETPPDDTPPVEELGGDDTPPAEDEGEGEETPLSREALRKQLAGEEEETPGNEDEPGLRGEQPTDSSKVRKRIKHYEGLLSDKETALETTKTELAALQEKVKGLEEKAGGLPEDIQDQLSELRQYRRRYSIEKDPEFQSRFASKLEESNELVDDALSSIGVSQKLRTQIKQAGGIGAFVRSDAMIPIKGKTGKTEQIDARQFVSLALNTMKDQAPDSEAVLRAELAAQRRIETEKAKFIDTETKEADKFFAEQEKREIELAANAEKVEEELEKVITTFKATVHTNDWMKDLEVPETAAPEERKAIIADNRFRKQLREFFDMQLTMPMVREAAKRATKQEELDEFANMLIDASRVFYVERQERALRKENERLKAELDKVRKASGRSTPRRTTGGRAPVDTSGEPKRSDYQSDLAFSIAHNRWKEANGQKVGA
jgi:hypothetical protein